MRLWKAIGAIAFLLLCSRSALADFPGLCNPNTFSGGPISGAPASPQCRAIGTADLPPVVVAPTSQVVIVNGPNDCINDAAPAINSALATGLPVRLGPGSFRIATPIVHSGLGVDITGEGWTEQGLSQFPNDLTGCTTSPGTYLSIQTPIAAFTFTSAGNSGPKFHHLGILQKQPAPGPGWVPNIYPPVFTLDDQNGTNAVSGSFFEDIGWGGVYDGIYAKGNVARVQMDTFYGQVFHNVFRVDNALDVSRANNWHFWGFWSGDVNVYNWQNANSEPFFFKRQDSFQAENIFIFGALSCVHLSQQTTGPFPGTGTAIHFGNLNCDSAKYTVWVDSLANAPYIAIDHLWHGGEQNFSSIPIVGGNLVQVDGATPVVIINDLSPISLDGSILNVTNTTQPGGSYRFGTIWGQSYNYSGCPGACSAFTGTHPTFNVPPVTGGAGQPVISVEHFVQPQIGGFTASGTNGGLINANANTILYAPAGQSWDLLTAVNGGSYAWPIWAETLLVTNAPIAGATLAMPLGALDGRQIQLVCQNTITTLTLNAPGATLINPPTTCLAGKRYSFKFQLTGSNWWTFQ